MYESLVFWRDLTDGHLYKAGDQFPYDGREISEERIEQLSGKQNKAGFALIKVALPFEETPTTEEKPVKKATRGRKKAE